MVLASAAETAVPGRTCESTGTSLPEAGGLPSRMAAPPARFTSRPFSTLRPLPLRHTTILPRTLSGDREFGRHWLRRPLLNHVSSCSSSVRRVSAVDYSLGDVSGSPRNNGVCCIDQRIRLVAWKLV